MTLATTIQILDPHPPEPLFRFCRELIGATQARFTHRPNVSPKYRHDPATMHPAEYANPPGQGLPAWLEVAYATDGPIIDPYLAEKDEEGWPHDPPHCLKVWLDTTYGYTADNGAGCGDLHAWIVLEVGLWCEARNLRYRWNDESSGVWYDSVLDVLTLGDPERGRLRPTPEEPYAPLPAEMEVASS